MTLVFLKPSSPIGPRSVVRMLHLSCFVKSLSFLLAIFFEIEFLDLNKIDMKNTQKQVCMQELYTFISLEGNNEIRVRCHISFLRLYKRS